MATVNPNVTPSVSIAASSTTICSGTSVTFTATPTNGGSSPSYQWKVNGANVGTNSSTYTTTTLANGQIVTVVMTSNATCASPTTATSNSIVMTVYTGSPTINSGNGPTTKPTISPSGSICPGPAATGITFTKPSSMGNAASYTWHLPPGFVITAANADSSIITVSVPGPGALEPKQPTSNSHG